MLVRDVMTREVYTAKPTDTPMHVAALMKRHNVGAIPICEGDRLVGIITDRDLVVECLTGRCDPSSTPVCEFMTADPIWITPDTPLERAAQLMGHEQVRRLCVCEENRLVGIVSLGDLAVSLFDDRLVAETLRQICAPLRVAFTPVSDGRAAETRQPAMVGPQAIRPEDQARAEWEGMLGSEL